MRRGGLIRISLTPEAVALAVHFKNVAVVGRLAHEHLSQPLSLEDVVYGLNGTLLETSKRAVVTVSEAPEHEFDTAGIQEDVTEFVRGTSVDPNNSGDMKIRTHCA
jgi:hypothetical protein